MQIDQVEDKLEKAKIKRENKLRVLKEIIEKKN